MTCKHLSLRVCQHPQARAYKARPLSATCKKCPFYEGATRGAGDVVHSVAKALRLDRLVAWVKPGCGCHRRRTWLNDFMPLTFLRRCIQCVYIAAQQRKGKPCQQRNASTPACGCARNATARSPGSPGKSA